MMQTKAFLMKSKHQCHLSQYGEWVYGAQIMKTKEITMWTRVCPNWQINFNTKKWWKDKLFLWNQSINVIDPNKEKEFMVPNREKKKRLLCESIFVPNKKWTLTLKIMEREPFFMKPKHQCHLSQCWEWVYNAQSWKERRLLCNPVFALTDKWPLTLKMMKREAYLMKLKHQCHLSKWGEWVYGP